MSLLFSFRNDQLPIGIKDSQVSLTDYSYYDYAARQSCPMLNAAFVYNFTIFDIRVEKSNAVLFDQCSL